ncbi:hypothetical protein HON22_00650 [Candidatus Peregrinibacteria bacterium]|jgi:hypothetical protein|nr:hypothetical protein [Candidatus Peregrinibacteria bacterium]
MQSNHEMHEIVASEICKEIAKRLEADPKLFNIAMKNLLQWEKTANGLAPAQEEWKNIVQTKTHEDILKILIMGDQESIRLRSSAPFVGILTSAEVQNIKYRVYGLQNAA